MPAQRKATEPDSLYILKVLLYFAIGTVWVSRLQGNEVMKLFPIGAVIGLLLVQHEHFRLDRKVEYLVLILAAILSLTPLFPGLDFLI